MRVDRIEDFQAFVTIVEKGSLTMAARSLGRSLQSVSRSFGGSGGGCRRRTGTPDDAPVQPDRGKVRLLLALLNMSCRRVECDSRRRPDALSSCASVAGTGREPAGHVSITHA
jgi:hypothetical protein